VTWRGGWDHCPRRSGLRYVDLDAPEDEYPYWDATCGAHVCPYCIETNYWRTTVAIEHARPERFAVFTGLPGEDWQDNRQAVNAVIRAIRSGVVPGTRRKWRHPKTDRVAKGWSIEHLYTLEAGAKTGMVHVNLYWHGSYVPQAFLSEVAVAVGWGPVVHVQDIRQAKGSKVHGYGAKEASGRYAYGLKEATGRTGESAAAHPSEALAPGQAAYLSRNGGQLVHASKGFWRDGVGGASLGNLRAAFRAAMAARDASTGARARRESEWVLSTPSGEVLAHKALTPAARGAGTDAPAAGRPGHVSPATGEGSAPGTPDVTTGDSTSASLSPPGLWSDAVPSVPRPTSSTSSPWALATATCSPYGHTSASSPSPG